MIHKESVNTGFIVTLHNLFSVCIGDFQSNNITIHNKGLIVVSEPFREKKHTITTTTTTTTTLTHNL